MSRGSKEQYQKDEAVKELIDNAMVLERLARHASTHAAGIVISNKPLMEYVPLYRGQKGETVTQYAMKTIEKIGLVKFDLLGLKTLTIIDNVIKMLEAEGIEARHHQSSPRRRGNLSAPRLRQYLRHIPA